MDFEAMTSLSLPSGVYLQTHLPNIHGVKCKHGSEGSNVTGSSIRECSPPAMSFHVVGHDHGGCDDVVVFLMMESCVRFGHGQTTYTKKLDLARWSKIKFRDLLHNLAHSSYYLKRRFAIWNDDWVGIRRN